MESSQVRIGDRPVGRVRLSSWEHPLMWLLLIAPARRRIWRGQRLGRVGAGARHPNRDGVRRSIPCARGRGGSLAVPGPAVIACAGEAREATERGSASCRSASSSSAVARRNRAGPPGADRRRRRGGRAVRWRAPVPHTMHRPGQSSRQSGAIGSARRIASRTSSSSSSSWWSVSRSVSGSTSSRRAGRWRSR